MFNVHVHVRVHVCMLHAYPRTTTHSRTSARGDGMAQPNLAVDIESEVRLSPEERAASWTDFRGLVTAPTSNRGPQMNPKPTRPSDPAALLAGHVGVR